MLGLLHNQFYWSGMTKDADVHIVNCDRCIHFKIYPEKAAMENIQATHPLELVLLNYLIVEATEGEKDAHILAITDHFMQYIQSLMTLSYTAKCTA